MVLVLALFGCDPCDKQEAAPHTSVPCAAVFDPAQVTEYSIVVEPEVWAALVDEYQNWEDLRANQLKRYHPLTSFRYGDEVITDAMIRLKGNPCCSWESDRMQFVIAFHKIDPDGRFHGLRKILLDGPPYDPSALRERVAWSYFEDAGLPAACANHATLTVNGALYGTYTHIEAIDDEFLERQFPGEEIGDLYKFDYLSQRWELQNRGTRSDIGPLLELYQLDDDLDGLVEAFDIDQALRFWAAEAVINQSDGYWAGSINFLLYDRPEHGWTLLPWDLDNAIDYWAARRNPLKRKDHHGHAGHLDTVLADPVWSGRFEDAVREMHGHLDSDVLIDRVDRWDEQIIGHLEAEPQLPFSLNDHAEAVDSLRAHLSLRDHYLCRAFH